MKNKLILAWKNPNTRTWTPVGILEYKENKYFFNYTKGAKVENFNPFGQMIDLEKTYESETLFPIFQNRLLSKSRPEYEDYLEWFPNIFPNLLFHEHSCESIEKLGDFESNIEELHKHLSVLNDYGQKIYFGEDKNESVALKNLASKYGIICSGKGSNEKGRRNQC